MTMERMSTGIGTDTGTGSGTGTPAEAAGELLRRSLARGRLGHAYLFTGDLQETLEDAAMDLTRTLLCIAPPERAPNGRGISACRRCDMCRRVTERAHPDVLWLRPESKMRQIGVDSIRQLIHSVNLKPMEAAHKVGVVVGADRMNESSANAFLKTLEEPPAGSVLILLTTEPQRLLDTIFSRCLRLSFGGGIPPLREEAVLWTRAFAEQASSAKPGDLLGRYRLFSLLMASLSASRGAIEERIDAASPADKYPDADESTRDRWEAERNAAVEAEYRRVRGDYLATLLWWLRDVWRMGGGAAADQLRLPELARSTAAIAERIGVRNAEENLVSWERTQRLLFTNVQESLALEVGLLKLKL